MNTRKRSAVTRKIVKQVCNQKDFDEKITKIIEKGGKTTQESLSEKEESEKEIRFTVRLPKKIVDLLDGERKSKSGHISRNQWIIEAVEKNLLKEI